VHAGPWRQLAILLFAFTAFAQPDAVEEVLKQAIGLHQAGKIEAAVAEYEKYLAQRPDSVLALSNLGAAYARLGRYEDAARRYRRALQLQPDNLAVELNLALAFYKTSQLPAAIELLQKVHRGAPAELQPVLLLADCWLRTGENKKVIELLAPAAEQRADDLAIAYLLGTALVRDEQYAKGQVIIDRILRNGESAEARLLLGTTKLNAGDYPAALVDLAKAVSLNPKLPDVYSYYGQALLRTGDPAAATEAYRKALAADPDDFAANLELGILLKGDDKLAEAKACLQRALRIRPANLPARYHIATLELLEGNADAARRGLEAIVKESPRYTEAHVTLATVYYRMQRKADGDRERAIVQKLNAEAQLKQQQGVNIK
jgi:tetratricopeptide (TPR) repeat protein